MGFPLVIILHFCGDMNEFSAINSSLVTRDNQDNARNQLHTKYLFWSISMLFSNKPYQMHMTSITLTMIIHINAFFSKVASLSEPFPKMFTHERENTIAYD